MDIIAIRVISGFHTGLVSPAIFELAALGGGVHRAW
jgi:hypothetical protein